MQPLIGHLDFCVCMCVCQVINARQVLIFPGCVHSKSQKDSSFNRIMRQLMEDLAIWSLFLVHLNRIAIIWWLHWVTRKKKDIFNREKGWKYFSSKFMLCLRMAGNMEERMYHKKFCILGTSFKIQTPVNNVIINRIIAFHSGLFMS